MHNSVCLQFQLQPNLAERIREISLQPQVINIMLFNNTERRFYNFSVFNNYTILYLDFSAMPLSRRTLVHCNCCDFFLLLSNFCHNRIFFPVDKHRNVILKATMPFIMRTTDVAAIAMHIYILPWKFGMRLWQKSIYKS